ncbi:MAG TPA: DUF1998 domain-containing protein [Balneolales bacterium]|nr:DUF1998 domain-containing protein [Balneolales bacterium]
MDSNIRTGQLLTPFGIGQIVTFPEEVSVMISGLNLWDKSLEERKISGGYDAVDLEQLKIPEERLQKLLNVEYLLKPFPYTEKSFANNYLKVPAVRFPSWHHCVNPQCGRMKKIQLSTHDTHIKCPDCESKMIPVRFVAVCQNGHIQDVPFAEWVHKGPVPNDGRNHTLRYKANSGSGDLGSIFISCNDCKKSRSLAGIMNIKKDEIEDIIYNSALAEIGLNKDENLEFSSRNPNTPEINPLGHFCKGYKPWLGLDGINNPDKCSKHLSVLIRGGSNVHYSNIQSALYLPKTKEDINEYAQRVIEKTDGGIKELKEYFEQQSGGALLKMVLKNKVEVKDGLISVDELFEEIISQFDVDENESENYNDIDIRWEEYQHILKGRNSENSDFKAIVKNFNKYEDADYLRNYFSNIVLIEKLIETRVFTGFSRITPNRGSLEERKEMLSNKPVKWLPAYQVQGEGIFLEFDSETLDQWVNKSSGYFETLIKRYHFAMGNRNYDYEKRDIDPIFVMMHTFAHLLIKRLCYNCGYGSSALREKIYFSSYKDQKMNGILIYTSSSDSEGSLGGLVRQGKEMYLAKLVRDSVADAEWCSADPVCSEVGQESGQGPDSVNGSACHNCCLVPETSCEEFNSLLDRATIKGTIENRELGFFYE